MCLSVLQHFFVIGVDIPLFLLKSTAMSTIVWISKGLFAINVMIDRLYQIGFSKQSIALINNFYTNASLCIKWKNQISKSMISIEQRVRQSGAHMCLSVLQHFFVIGVDIPLFLLKSTAMSTIVWISKGLFAINVTSSAQVGAQAHIGIQKSETNSTQSTVNENIKKATKALYSLMGVGLHGENEIDPETLISLLRTYVCTIYIILWNVTTIHSDDIFISMRLVLLIPTMYHTGVCNSVKANSQKSFVGYPTILSYDLTCSSEANISTLYKCS
jgi:uncharacterized membrane protein YGL010W